MMMTDVFATAGRRRLAAGASLLAAGALLSVLPTLAAPPRHKAGVHAGKPGLTSRPVKRQDEPKDDTTTKPVLPPDVPGVVVLFSGKEDEMKTNWVKRGGDQPGAWPVTNGAMTSKGGDITTKQTFGDFQLHVEFKVPYMPEAALGTQHRGNSGIGIFSLYEIQVLDSYGIKTPGTGDCGAVYEQAAPLINASKPPRQWQTYDITWRAARWQDGKKMENARVTVVQNGIVVQNNTEVKHETGIAFGAHEADKPGPVLLQDHGNPMQFRNVWIVPLPSKGRDQYEGEK